MDFSVIYSVIFAYITGGLTVLVIFRKKIFNETVSYTPSNKNGSSVVDKLTNEFYSLLSSNIDLTIYKNTVDAAEFERQRIGTDMHDEMATHLSALYFDLEVVSREGHKLSIEADKLLYTMRNKIKNTAVSLRKIIYGILPAHLKNATLDHAIKELCTKHDSVKGTTVLFRSLGVSSPLKDIEKLYLYRIAQELINNCFQHSKAWRIFVSLNWSEYNLILTIKDTGVGIPKFIEHGNKYGMTGIFIRAMIIGAIAKFNNPIEGTEFELILPLTTGEITNLKSGRCETQTPQVQTYS